MAEKKVQRNHCLKLIAILWNKPGFWIHLPGGLGSHAGPGFWILVVSSFQYSHDLFWQLSPSWLSLPAGAWSRSGFFGAWSQSGFWMLLDLEMCLFVVAPPCDWLSAWSFYVAAGAELSVKPRSLLATSARAGFEEADGTFGAFCILLRRSAILRDFAWTLWPYVLWMM